MFRVVIYITCSRPRASAGMSAWVCQIPSTAVTLLSVSYIFLSPFPQSCQLPIPWALIIAHKNLSVSSYLSIVCLFIFLSPHQNPNPWPSPCIHCLIRLRRIHGKNNNGAQWSPFPEKMEIQRGREPQRLHFHDDPVSLATAYWSQGRDLPQAGPVRSSHGNLKPKWVEASSSDNEEEATSWQRPESRCMNLAAWGVQSCPAVLSQALVVQQFSDSLSWINSGEGQTAKTKSPKLQRLKQSRSLFLV